MCCKILFITSSLVCGGAERVITFIANEMSKNNKVYVYSYEGGQPNYPLSNKVSFIPEVNIATNYYSRRFIQIFQVRKKISELKPDIVVSFLTNQNVFAVLGTLFTRIPVIISERGDPNVNKGIVSKIKYFFYNYASTVVFQTEEAKKCFNKNIQGKSVVIPNPVTNPSFCKNKVVSKRSEDIVFVARMEIKQKRHDLMIKAFKIIADQYKELRLVFYGNGEDLEKVKNLVHAEGLDERVIFAGKVDNVLECIYNSKMFVLTSDYEGIPNALIEAMSIGVPVISTDCSPGGARLLIENHVNGIIVPRGSINEIAEGIRFYCDNPEIAEKYGMNGKGICNKFSPEKIMKSWEFLINKYDKGKGNLYE